jgi:hypothetical protein
MVSPEVAAIALTFAVHVFGMAVLIVVGRGEDEPLFRNWWPREGGDDTPPTPPAPRLGPDGLPLDGRDDFEASRTRLREPGRIGTWRPRPRTRRTREPERVPVRRSDRDAS